uniref:Uncharacterized protein n=1 Tax=Anopheles minimus TaxID=112268 RepID=A0A182WC21_9DIPT
MVFFTCNHCGESLKKQIVANHAWRCKRDINVSCMDCMKDFIGQAYDAHTVCISEAEKYSGKGFVPKVNKGAQKHENWISKVRSIAVRNNHLSPGVKNVFEIIKRNDNIPRKCKPFRNFFLNSHRSLYANDVDAAWALIEQEMKSGVQTPVEKSDQKQKSDVPSTNGTTDPMKNDESQNGQQKKAKTKQSSENDETAQPKKQKKSKNKQKQKPENNLEVEQPQSTKQKKRKTKETSDNGHQEEEPHSTNQKKRKTEDSSQNCNGNGAANGTDPEEEQLIQNGGEEKINLSGIIREFLIARNNQMKLSKLKKKVMKRYQQATGVENDGKFEKKFQKKIAKNGFVVENDTVRLVEA